jgi:Protein of unknown function (DUF4058)
MMGAQIPSSATSENAMPSPFPGMDPYLEQPTLWASFHSRLIVATLAVSAKQRADALAPSLRPKYY